MLHSVIAIGENMIRARICQAIGDEDEAADQFFEAGLEARDNAYSQAKSDSEVMRPTYLKFYPELTKFWNKGLEDGIEYWEIQHCNMCQDPDIEICSYHG